MEGRGNGLGEIYCRAAQCLPRIEWKYERELSGSNSQIDKVEAANGERRLKKRFGCWMDKHV